MTTEERSELHRLRSALPEGGVSLDCETNWTSGTEEPKTEWRAYSTTLGYSKRHATAQGAVDALLASARTRLEELAAEKEAEAGRLRQAAAAVEQTKSLPF